MIAFRHLLSPKVKFFWTEELAREFVLAKLNMIGKFMKVLGQALCLWKKHCDCGGPITIACCWGGWQIVFMSLRFNNDAQSRYSPIEWEAFTVYWATSKAEYFIYGCDKLYIGIYHKPLLAFVKKVEPKPLDHIVNKRLRKYVSEISALRFTIFHIAGAKNYLSDRGSRFPSGWAGDDRGESPESTKKCDIAVGYKNTIKSHSACWNF